VNALHHEIRGRILNPAVNGWAMDERPVFGNPHSEDVSFYRFP